MNSHFHIISKPFINKTKCAVGAALILAAVAGCNNSGSSDNEAARRTKISSSDKSTSGSPARISSIENKEGKSKQTAGSQTVAKDNTLTQPMVLIAGKLRFDDGATVTTGTVKVIQYERGETGNLETRESRVSQISSDSSYEIETPSGFALTLFFEGEFPGTYEGVSPDELPKTSTLKKIKKDVTVQRGVEVRGRVIDDKNQPVNDALVTLRYTDPGRGHGSSSEASTSSTASGEFVLPYVRQGKSKAMAFHKDLVTGLADVDVPTSEPVVITMLTEGATVTGHVYRQESGQPQAGVTVSVIDKITYKPKESISQADGSFRIEKIRPGQNALAASSKEPRLGRYPMDRRQVNQQLDLSDKETTDVTVLVYGGHILSGKVFDKETGEPIADASVQTYDGSTSTSTVGDGSFLIKPLFPGTSPGTIQVRAKKDGYIAVTSERYEQGVVNVPATTSDLNPAVEIPMIKTVTVSGTVKSADGVPIPNATVELKNQNYNSREAVKSSSSSDGTYKLEVRPFHDAVVKASSAGFASGYSASFHVDNLDLEDVDVILEVGATLSGTVVDPDGKPVASANVGSYSMMQIGNSGASDAQDSAKTDQAGAFTLTNLPKNVHVSASHTEYASAKGESVDLKAGEVKSGLTLQLLKGYSISGKVLDSSDKPVQGAWVYSSGGGSSKNTGEDGTFELTQIPEGTYRIQASGQGGSAQLEGVKAGSENVILKFQARTNEPRDKATMIGTVVDASTNEPLEKFEIQNVGSISKDPDRKGGVSITDLEQGTTFELQITAPGYPKANVQVTVPKQISFEHTLKIGKGGAITGTVVEAGSGKPLPNILVVNWGRATEEYARQSAIPESSVMTDADGKFTLAPAPVGENYMVVRPAAPLTEVGKTIKVANDEIADAGAIELDSGGILFGKVTFGNDKQPIANTSVQITGHRPTTGETYRKSATTADDGSYRVESLAAANYTIGVNKYSVRESLAISAGDEKELNIHIGGTTVFGTVTRGGQPIRCSVSASKTNGEKLQASASTSGEPYKLTGLSPGQWKFFVYPYEENNSGRSHEETITIPDQEEFEKNFTLPNISIAGIVVDANGEPVPAAQVQLSQKQTSAGGGDSWRGGYNASITTKADGRFSFNSIAEGTYQVFAKKDGLGSAMESSVTPRDGAPVDLRLQLDPVGGTLVSIVLNMADGTGLQPAWCYLYGENGRYTHNAKRDAGGTMRIENIPPGRYTANVSSWGFSQSDRTVEIKRGETATIEDVLYAAGAIEWSLAKADGLAADATGVATPLDQGSIEQPKNGTTAAGKLVIRGLAPGNYQVTAQIPGKPAVSDTFTVIAGDIARKSTTVPTW